MVICLGGLQSNPSSRDVWLYALILSTVKAKRAMNPTQSNQSKDSELLMFPLYNLKNQVHEFMWQTVHASPRSHGHGLPDGTSHL